MDQEKLKLLLLKLIKRGAPALVALAINRHWLMPDMAGEATAFVIEVLEYVGLALLGAAWAWFDAHKTATAIATGERRVEIALDLPAGSTKATVDATIAREELAVHPRARPTSPGVVPGYYDPKTKRFFPDGQTEKGSDG